MVQTSTGITTLIFDVDDTLYDVSTGFTAHRNGEGSQRFMVEYLDFPDSESAKQVRDKYFERYHSTAKALAIAEQEGAFPPSSKHVAGNTPRFDPQVLAEYWASKLDFSLLGGRRTKLLQDLQECPLRIIAFSNGPRKYVKRVLLELGLWDAFGEHRVFAVDNVLPHCKPEPEAFKMLFQRVGVIAEECVMIEDSMKNIRVAKTLGMKTVLVTGSGRIKGSRGNRSNTLSLMQDESEATKVGDIPQEDDPAVDVAIETVEELRSVLPGLWKLPAHFEPT